MIDINKIHLGDFRDIIKLIDTDSIDLIVSSPPYHLNKEYELTVSYEDYCDMMHTLFMECNRVLKPGKYFVVNFGDYFNSGNRFYDADIPACYPASINYYKWGVEESQMDLQATRIWRKNFNRMPIPFVCNHHPRNVFDYEHIWTFRKRNGENKEEVRNRKLSQRGVIGEDWTVPAQLDKHCAAFPIGLPQWAIEVYSDANDIVMDPFMGSGTTALAAVSLNRQFVGMEKESHYHQLACDNLTLQKKNMKTMFDTLPAPEKEENIVKLDKSLF